MQWALDIFRGTIRSAFGASVKRVPATRLFYGLQLAVAAHCQTTANHDYSRPRWWPAKQLGNVLHRDGHLAWALDFLQRALAVTSMGTLPGRSTVATGTWLYADGHLTWALDVCSGHLSLHSMGTCRCTMGTRRYIDGRVTWALYVCSWHLAVHQWALDCCSGHVTLPSWARAVGTLRLQRALYCTPMGT